MTGSEPGGLDDLDWVVWNIEVQDPDQLTEPDVGQRTDEAMTEMAGALGCVFVQCVDDDAVDGVPYYQWTVRVPREQHHRRDQHGVPIVVAALHAHLRTQVPPAVDSWLVRPDRDASVRDEAQRLLRDCYQELLDPLEVALLGLRRDGAQALDPATNIWWHGDNGLAGTYVMWLGEDPDTAGNAFRPWLLVYAGLATNLDFWNSRHGKGLLRHGVSSDHPVLILPMPAPSEQRWLVAVTTGLFERWPGNADPTAIGTRYQWTSRDARQLARRVATDLQAIFPNLARSLGNG